MSFRRRTPQEAWEEGKRLCGAKEKTPHGEWADYLRRRQLSKSTAHRLMKLYRDNPFRPPAERPAAEAYAITDGDYIKIGHTSMPGRRLQTMQTGNARLLRIWKSHPCESVDEARRTEEWLRELCYDHHVRGEWFDKKCAPELERAFRKLADTDATS